MHSAVDVSDITVCVCANGPAAQVLQEYPLTNYRFQGWVEAAVFRYYFFAWPMQTMLALASRGNPGGRPPPRTSTRAPPPTPPATR